MTAVNLDRWLFVVQLRNGKLHPMSREGLAGVQQLAAATGGEASVVLIGSDTAALAQELAALDLASVYVADDPALNQYTPGSWVAALRVAIGATGAGRVLFAHTYQTVEFMPRLAHALDAALVPEAQGFRLDGSALVWLRPVLGGKLLAEVRTRGTATELISLQSGAFSADDLAAGQAEIVRLDLAGADLAADREILGVEEVAGEHVDLTQADRIVAAGRGVGGADKMGVVDELAAALGAEIGASRPVIDSGWLDRDRQIGSSGQTVAPKLYFAVGISGAIQHLVGMKGSQTVVAVNKDANAPIFSVADYGIVGDLHELLPAITAALVAAKE